LAEGPWITSERRCGCIPSGQRLRIRLGGRLPFVLGNHDDQLDLPCGDRVRKLDQGPAILGNGQAHPVRLHRCDLLKSPWPVYHVGFYPWSHRRGGRRRPSSQPLRNSDRLPAYLRASGLCRFRWKPPTPPPPSPPPRPPSRSPPRSPTCSPSW